MSAAAVGRSTLDMCRRQCRALRTADWKRGDDHYLGLGVSGHPALAASYDLGHIGRWGLYNCPAMAGAWILDPLEWQDRRKVTCVV